MHSFTGLTLNGKYFSKRWILDLCENPKRQPFTKHESKTLSFCAEWLSGAGEFIIETSGSTGKPRPIRLSRSRMILSAKMTGEALNLKPGDRALACLSTYHIGGLMMLVRGFVLGLELTVVAPSRNPFESFGFRNTSAIEKAKTFDFASFVPLQLQTVLSQTLDHSPLLDKMKAILLGGAPVSPKLVDRAQRVKASIYQTFGMTETVSHFALRRINGPTAAQSYTALTGVELGQDSRGCLTIKSGLTNNQQIVTNDLVDLVSNDSFTWRGRIDNVINSGGVKVQAEKVELAVSEVLRQMDGDDLSEREFFVGPLSDETYGHLVTVVFEGAPFSGNHEDDLRQALRRKLTKYEIPKRFFYVRSLIRAQNGKIDRRANLDQLLTQRVKELRRAGSR